MRCRILSIDLMPWRCPRLDLLWTRHLPDMHEVTTIVYIDYMVYRVLLMCSEQHNPTRAIATLRLPISVKAQAV